MATHSPSARISHHRQLEHATTFSFTMLFPGLPLIPFGRVPHQKLKHPNTLQDYGSRTTCHCQPQEECGRHGGPWKVVMTRLAICCIVAKDKRQLGSIMSILSCFIPLSGHSPRSAWLGARIRSLSFLDRQILTYVQPMQSSAESKGCRIPHIQLPKPGT